MNRKIAYLGPEGSFTHHAAMKFFGSNVELVNTPAHQIPRMVKSGPHNGGCDFGILAVENIAHGFIESTFDALYNTSDVQIIGEVYLPIAMNLISRASSVDEITHIFSHEAGLSQCRKHIDSLEKQHNISFSRSPAPSTSAAVEMCVSAPSFAAVGSKIAAKKYGLPVLSENIHDHPENVTRFWIFSMGKTSVPGERNKTVFLVEIDSRPSSLAAEL